MSKSQKLPELDFETGYSGVVRSLKEGYSENTLKQFRQVFKTIFDKALLTEQENPDELALRGSIEFVKKLEEAEDKKTDAEVKEAVDTSVNLLIKTADAHLGDPVAVGHYLSGLIRFLCRRISEKNRERSINKLKNKLYLLNEYELAGKKMPPAASMGQSITVVKHILFGKDPIYVRQVLNSIVRNL